MDHSYSSCRNKKLDHSYFSVAKKTPTVVLRKAQAIKEQMGRELLPVNKDHSYHRPMQTASIFSHPKSKDSPAASKKHKNPVKSIKVSAGKSISLKCSHLRLKKLIFPKSVKSHHSQNLRRSNVKDSEKSRIVSDNSSSDVNVSIQFEHSYHTRCENVESSDPCDSLPILIDLNKDCDISENAPLPDPSYFYNFVHDHAYISLKMFPFSNVHLSLDKVFS